MKNLKLRAKYLAATFAIFGGLFSYSNGQQLLGNQALQQPTRKTMNIPWEIEPYKYLSYDEMREKMQELKKTYPFLIKVESSQEKYGLPHYVECGTTTCVIDIVTITDFQTQSADKVQVYISGTLHGDEVIGPNVAYYLIEYLLSNYLHDPQVTNMLQNREIIITPMTNAAGYYHNEREERINLRHPAFISNPGRNRNRKVGSVVDINRDFPYNTETDACLNTVAARVVHQIFTQNLIVSAITFHGGTNVIGYPWGSYNRVTQISQNDFKSKESPDYQAFNSIGQILKNQSGGPISSPGSSIPIQEYKMGDISSTIYPVKGGLEDWAYAAGWDYFGSEATVSKCEPYTYSLPRTFSQAKEAYQNVRSAIYIVETDASKRPSERFLGSRQIYHGKSNEGLEVPTRFRVNPNSVMDQNNAYDGHINRNIRLALSLIDLSKPSIEIISYNQSTTDDKLQIKWRVNGCHTLNEARVSINGQSSESLIPAGKEGFCNYLGEQTIFTTDCKSSDSVDFEAIADQDFGENIDSSKVDPPEMANKPQLHLTKMRTQDNYEIRHGTRVLKGGRILKYSKDQYLLQKQLLNTEIISQTGVQQSEGLSCKLNPVENYQLTGVFSLTRLSVRTGSVMVNGQLNHLPIKEDLEVKIMEYGDLSSLVVEYPDYNSLGNQLVKLAKVGVAQYTIEATKIQENFQLPKSIPTFGDLAGRALIVTTMDGDLVAYGILVNEQKQAQSENVPEVKGVAMCESIQSTIPYRAYFDLKQIANGNVTFRGMLRTSQVMGVDDQMIVSVNGGRQFDIDFETAYGTEAKNDLFEYWHPCYKINEETVEGQAAIIGRDLEMYGINPMIFPAGQASARPEDNVDSQDVQSPTFHQTNLLRILETSKCYIGTQNPQYRISDESFCRQPLSRSQTVARKYTAMALVNFTIIGFITGLVMSFIVYFVQRLQHVGEDDEKVQRRIQRMKDKRDQEAVLAADSSFTHTDEFGHKRIKRKRTGTGLNDSSRFDDESNSSQYYNNGQLHTPGITEDDNDSERTDEGYSLSVRQSVKEKGEFIELANFSSEQKNYEIERHDN